MPTLQCGDETQQAVIQIAELLNRSVPLPPPVIPPDANKSKQHVSFADPLVSKVPITSSSPPSLHTTINNPASSPRVQKIPLQSDNDELAKAIIDALKDAEKPKNKQSWKPGQPVTRSTRYNLRSRTPSFQHLAAQYIATQQFLASDFKAYHIFNPITGKKETIDTLLRGPNKNNGQ